MPAARGPTRVTGTPREVASSTAPPAGTASTSWGACTGLLIGTGTVSRGPVPTVQATVTARPFQNATWPAISAAASFGSG